MESGGNNQPWKCDKERKWWNKRDDSLQRSLAPFFYLFQGFYCAFSNSAKWLLKNLWTSFRTSGPPGAPGRSYSEYFKFWALSVLHFSAVNEVTPEGCKCFEKKLCYRWLPSTQFIIHTNIYSKQPHRIRGLMLCSLQMWVNTMPVGTQ